MPSDNHISKVRSYLAKVSAEDHLENTVLICASDHPNHPDGGRVDGSRPSWDQALPLLKAMHVLRGAPEILQHIAYHGYPVKGSEPLDALLGRLEDAVGRLKEIRASAELCGPGTATV